MKNRIRQARLNKKISQAELARRAGITRSYLSVIENGKINPTIGVALRLAKELDVNLNDIFFEENVRHNAQ